jgi:hypothetical protein
MRPPDLAAVKQHWSSAVQSLKALTAAAADKPTTKQQLQDGAAAAEAECRQALEQTLPQAAGASQQGSIPEATRGVIVEDLKVGSCCAKAISSYWRGYSASC